MQGTIAKTWITADLIVGIIAQIYAVLAYVLAQLEVLDLNGLVHYGVAMAFGSAAIWRWYSVRREGVSDGDGDDSKPMLSKSTLGKSDKPALEDSGDGE